MKYTQTNVGLAEHSLPLHGADNPSTLKQGTSPASFCAAGGHRWSDHV